MKKTVLYLILLAIFVQRVHAQDLRGIDKSPMDMAYFPDDFAHDIRFAPEKLEFDRAIIRVVYSRPAKNGREVFGNMVPYGEVWRVGANEAPEIKFYEDVSLNGKKIKAGSYALLAIAGEKEWILILSKDVDQWGAYSYDKKDDVLRVKASVTQLSNPIENFTIQFEGKGKGKKEGIMKLAWDQTLVELPFTF
ncbi:DUF2911 domain-containing protein [Catalinimonas niigatensis]|uniref:DUF2911 domain-containing protein n=1 Tax=Catalinimonas niigatensis TaxID=1397264 RepID=UPI0026658755|nr:DUF2911 domain-containing protein [Catalinimonas niigatensis]WPP49374.1 DUF2911 domain-containing protein [Catalinimonas niigatensis]